MRVTYRRLSANDVTAVERLVRARAPGAPYTGIAGYFLERALAADGHGSLDAEARAIVAETDVGVVGVGIFGFVGGAVASGRIIYLSGDPDGATAVARELVAAMTSALVHAGARCITAEVPDDAPHVPDREALVAAGYEVVGRIDDYYREGTAMLLLWRPITDAPPDTTRRAGA